MAKIIYPQAHLWGPTPGTIVFDDLSNAPLDVLDFDGVWFAEDPRVLMFRGMSIPGPRAIVYKIPGSPPDGANKLTEQFVSAQAALTETKAIDTVSSNLLRDQRLDFLERYRGYLETIQSTLFHGAGLEKYTCAVDVANKVQFQNAPRNGDVLPHIDLEDGITTENIWTVFCTIAGDAGTILHTNRQHLIQLEAGEIATWRGSGPHGTWHSPPPSPYSRAIFSVQGNIPSRPVPAAIICFDGRPEQRTLGFNY